VVDGSLTILDKAPACESLTSGNCPITFGEVLKYSKTITVDPAWRPVSRFNLIFHRIRSDRLP
jgi:hypothetical protein